ncbi:glycoside hydrolase family 43 protein [Vagococcus fluvialis]|uniref:glycoside hydrolase family 43 protein n=1 Tax=Vagococcus fluvialis TaxID=2738 RepID=UPI001A8F2947|nr:family 43 glycosylhydrolase [Vagococcus fluvialis]MBO0488167.1 family 43 glycosylhydrolase [Vagococcus fluvialis]
MVRYKNPVVIERADPWIYKHTDGYYYFTGSVPGYQLIELRRSKTINGLENGERKEIWFAHEEGLLSELIWAPEVHFIDGKWYIYFAASDHPTVRNNEHFHRMFVIENSNENPFDGDWVEKGQIKTHQESFSLDATVFEHKDELYYVWAQLEPTVPGNSNLYISKMENPWTLKGKTLLLSIPEYDWEKIGFKVNEGAAVIFHDNRILITYSASATDENYAMGLLWANVDADLLDGYSWHKLKEPVFVSSEKNSQYGPGHNSFTVSEDGEKDLLVYHARPEKNKKGDPLANPNRHARVQEFSWDENGFPIFGEPVADYQE